MNVKSLLKRLGKLDIYFTGRTLSEEDMTLSDEDRDKAVHKHFETERNLFGYIERLYGSALAEIFTISETKYFLGFPIKIIEREYDEEGMLVKRSVANFLGREKTEFNPVFEKY